MPHSSASRPLLRLHIELADIEPPIWRDVVVPASITLAQLHEVLQAALGWHDLHLHEFHLHNRHYGPPGQDGDDDPVRQDETGHTLAEALGNATHFNYVYDFGDAWEHHISVAAQLPSPALPALPWCLAGANAGPPEDVGGAGAYSQFVEAMADPQHADHETLLDWHGQPFDPQAWDIERVNRRLKRLRHAWGQQELNRS
ncbi:plasmid pRiA4b ORF-3 family protein [Pseudomonas sp. TE3610]